MASDSQRACGMRRLDAFLLGGVAVIDPFHSFLASRRPYTARLALRNPRAADELAAELQIHLKTIEQWLNGFMDRGKMLVAMRFFQEEFPGRFGATDGRVIVRGQKSKSFNGDPRSYSYEMGVARDFACSIFKTTGFLVKRTVCFRDCPDRKAFALSLDMAKVLKAYATHKYAGEKEVVILNTEVKKPGEVLEVECW